MLTVASTKTALKGLHADDGKDECQKEGDDEDISNGLDRDDHAADDLSQARGALDCAQGTQHTEDTQHTHHSCVVALLESGHANTHMIFGRGGRTTK